MPIPNDTRLGADAPDNAKAQREGPDHIMQFFVFGHLPPPLQAISQPFSALADRIVATTPRNPERTVALRKLLESKDAAVRAVTAQGDAGLASQALASAAPPTPGVYHRRPGFSGDYAGEDLRG